MKSWKLFPDNHVLWFPIDHFHKWRRIWYSFVFMLINFVLLFTNSFLKKRKKNSCLLQVEKLKLFFKNRYLQRRLVYCICKVRCVCAGGSEKIVFSDWGKKISKLFARLWSVRTVKKVWPRSWKCRRPAALSRTFQDLGILFTIRTSLPKNNICVFCPWQRG